MKKSRKHEKLFAAIDEFLAEVRKELRAKEQQKPAPQLRTRPAA